MLVHLVNLVYKRSALSVAIADGPESVPQTDEHDLRLRPHLLHVVHERDVALQIVARGDVVGGVVVVCAQANHRDVRGGMPREVPRLWLVAVDGCGATARVARLEPLVRLAARVSPAVLVHETDARIGRDAVLYIAKAGAGSVRETREAFVRAVHACAERVADELYALLERGDADEAALAGVVGVADVDGGDLDAIGPVCDT